MPETEFEGVREWPEEGPPAKHNAPPLEESVVFDFDDSIQRAFLDRRVWDITKDAEKAPPEITNPEDAGAVGDLIAQAKAATEAVQNIRETFNRPLLTAQRNLKGRADSLLMPMDLAIKPLRDRLDEFKAANPEVTHGEMGARVGARTVWDFEIVDAAKLPLAIRRHPTVIAAIEKVIRSLVKGGERKIPGVKIWSNAKALVR